MDTADKIALKVITRYIGLIHTQSESIGTIFIIALHIPWQGQHSNNKNSSLMAIVPCLNYCSGMTHYPILTLLMYSESRSCNACLTLLHSLTILSRLSSRVHPESAINAAPLMMLSSLSSSDGRVRTSLYWRGSMINFCYLTENLRQSWIASDMVICWQL